MKRSALLIAALLASLVAIPFIPFDARTYVMQVLTMLFVFHVLAQSYNIVGGTMGYVNLGHISFFGLGAYSFGIAYNAGWGLVLSLLGALAVVILFAFAFSYPFFRLRGAYFSLAAFGLVKLMEYVTNNLGWLTGGSNGLKIAADNRTFPVYFMALSLSILAVVSGWAINRSRFGLAMKTIREDEAVARDFGVPTTRIKTQALVLSSILPALMGGLYTWNLNFIDPTQVYGLKIALQPVAMAMLGGTGLVIGPVAGTAFLYLIEEVIWTNFEHLHGAMLGTIIVLVGLFMPGGLARLPMVERLLERLGLREEDK